MTAMKKPIPIPPETIHKVARIMERHGQKHLPELAAVARATRLEEERTRLEAFSGSLVLDRLFDLHPSPEAVLED